MSLIPIKFSKVESAKFNCNCGRSLTNSFEIINHSCTRPKGLRGFNESSHFFDADDCISDWGGQVGEYGKQMVTRRKCYGLRQNYPFPCQLCGQILYSSWEIIQHFCYKPLGFKGVYKLHFDIDELLTTHTNKKIAAFARSMVPKPQGLEVVDVICHKCANCQCRKYLKLFSNLN